MSVDVVAELDADLSLRGLVFDEAVPQQLLCVGALGVVLEQTRLHKVLQLLGPATCTKGEGVWTDGV